MLKKFFIALAIALVIPAVASAQKFGVVDAGSILQAMPAFTAMQTQLNEASQKYQEEYQKLSEEVDKKYKEFQALDPATPDAIKQRRMEEVQQLAMKQDSFRQTAEQDLQRQQQTLMAPIEEKLNSAIKSVGQEGNFTFIFPEGIAAYQGSDVINVTELVKAKLDIK